MGRRKEQPLRMSSAEIEQRMRLISKNDTRKLHFGKEFLPISLISAIEDSGVIEAHKIKKSMQYYLRANEKRIGAVSATELGLQVALYQSSTDSFLVVWLNTDGTAFSGTFRRGEKDVAHRTKIDDMQGPTALAYAVQEAIYRSPYAASSDTKFHHMADLCKTFRDYSIKQKAA